MQDETLRQWGENIAIRRQALNADGRLRKATEPAMTQRQLGDRLDPPVHQSTVARWEAGITEPRRRYKAQLCSVLLADYRMLFSATRAPVGL
jgi:DNA-binding XRE family transcriptional regulator